MHNSPDERTSRTNSSCCRKKVESWSIRLLLRTRTLHPNLHFPLRNLRKSNKNTRSLVFSGTFAKFQIQGKTKEK